MDEKKTPSHTADSHNSRNSLELANAVAVSEKQGTQNDETDMDRMGKLQVLRVRLNKSLNDASLRLHSTASI
jgi:choline transport protein